MNREDIRYIGLLFREIAGRERKIAVCTFLLAILEAANPYIMILCTGVLVDGVYRKESMESLLFYTACALGLKLLLRVACSRMGEWFNQKLDYTRQLDEEQLNRQSLSMDYEYLEDTHVQELRTRALARSYYGIRGWLLLQVREFLKGIFSMLTALVIVFPMLAGGAQMGGGGMFSLLASLLLLLVIGVLVWGNYRAGIYYTRKSVEILDGLDGIHNKSAYYLDLLSGVESQKDLRIHAQQRMIRQDVDALFEASRKGEWRIGQMYIRRQLIGVTFPGLSGLCIYLFAGIKAFLGQISIGNVVSYTASIIQLARSASRFAGCVGRMKSVADYSRDYMQYRNLEKRKRQGTIPVEKRRDGRFQIDFEHVSFRYPGTEEYVISDLTLSFEIGEKMAIVGPNGSGKTTFIKLLCRLYDVTEGCIKLNGIDIRKYDYQEYCALFAVVFQDFCIFAFPLGENIAAAGVVEEAAAEDALVRAGLGERLAKLPQGLATYVGRQFSDGGVSFSGGEKQKMAIARAIYKDAPFVIMDEPTAALDPLAECDVYAGFDRMVGKKTALYISHRLASCRFCEDILVFDKGRVVQRGSHEELAAQQGLYRRLWNAQAQYYQQP